MQTKHALQALAFLLAGSLTTAQTDVRKAQVPQGEVQDVAACKLEPAVELEFSVIGLTQENRERVQESLTSLKAQIYVCASCKHQQTMAGTCAPCALQLEVKVEPLLLQAVPSVAKASIHLIPMSARTLRYSDLASALTKSSILIDDARFPLAGKSRLVLHGGSAENAELIEKALVDAKLFELVEASFDAPSGEIRIAVHASATPPMHAKVSALIEALGTKAKLTDVIWGLPTPPTKV